MNTNCTYGLIGAVAGAVVGGSAVLGWAVFAGLPVAANLGAVGISSVMGGGVVGYVVGADLDHSGIEQKSISDRTVKTATTKKESDFLGDYFDAEAFRNARKDFLNEYKDLMTLPQTDSPLFKIVCGYYLQYSDKFKEMYADYIPLTAQLIKRELIKEFPTVRPINQLQFDSLLTEFMVSMFGMWVPVDLTWTKELAKNLKGMTVLEVCAGKQGWLAKALSYHGITVIATNDKLENPVTEMIEMDAVDAVKKYRQADVLLMSWPPYREDIAAQAYEEFQGTKVVYIGGDYEGCTANKRFFKLISSIDNSDSEVDSSDGEQYSDYGINKYNKRDICIPTWNTYSHSTCFILPPYSRKNS